jgi:hypothetical protein
LPLALLFPTPQKKIMIKNPWLVSIYRHRKEEDIFPQKYKLSSCFVTLNDILNCDDHVPSDLTFCDTHLNIPSLPNRYLIRKKGRKEGRKKIPPPPPPPPLPSLPSQFMNLSTPSFNP